MQEVDCSKSIMFTPSACLVVRGCASPCLMVRYSLSLWSKRSGGNLSDEEMPFSLPHWCSVCFAGQDSGNWAYQSHRSGDVCGDAWDGREMCMKGRRPQLCSKTDRTCLASGTRLPNRVSIFNVSCLVHD
jgi:hypothetical protein